MYRSSLGEIGADRDSAFRGDARAVASPMPDAAPVTSTTLPASFPSVAPIPVL